mmetsp:Transcript_29140/g.71579  ORF Transcript_29140/g.71579 Transcript_29140/m.71579 type:complete len:224 (+) Transcript_29140:1912-2583(+)
MDVRLPVPQAARIVVARPAAAVAAAHELVRGRPAEGLLAGGLHVPHRLPDGTTADVGAQQQRVHRHARLGVPHPHRRGEGRDGAAKGGRVYQGLVPRGRRLVVRQLVPVRARADGARLRDAHDPLQADRGQEVKGQGRLPVPRLSVPVAHRLARAAVLHARHRHKVGLGRPGGVDEARHRAAARPRGVIVAAALVAAAVRTRRPGRRVCRSMRAWKHIQTMPG